MKLRSLILLGLLSIAYHRKRKTWSISHLSRVGFNLIMKYPSPEYPKEWLWSDGWDGIPCRRCRRNHRNGNGMGSSSKAPGTPRCCQHLGKRSPRFSKYGRTVSWIRKVSPVRPRSGSQGNRIPSRIGKRSIRRRSDGPCPIIRIVSSHLHNWQIWSKNC